jgi:hypothetical protein
MTALGVDESAVAHGLESCLNEDEKKELQTGQLIEPEESLHIPGDENDDYEFNVSVRTIASDEELDAETYTSVISYVIDHGGDESAGLRSYDDLVTIYNESGDWHGQPGEFLRELKDFLSEWYDGAKVYVARPRTN